MTQFTTELLNFLAPKRDTDKFFHSSYGEDLIMCFYILKIKTSIRSVSGGGFGGEPINFD